MSNSPAVQWDLVAKDDLAHKLSEVHEFYNRKPPNNVLGIWLNALYGYPMDDIIKAFDTHYQTGAHFPRPVEIRGILGNLRDRHKADQQAEVFNSNCDPEIAAAWTYYLRKVLGFHSYTPAVKINWDRALQIVNEQAVKYNRPDSLLPEYRLPEFFPNG